MASPVNEFYIYGQDFLKIYLISAIFLPQMQSLRSRFSCSCVQTKSILLRQLIFNDSILKSSTQTKVYFSGRVFDEGREAGFYGGGGAVFYGGRETVFVLMTGCYGYSVSSSTTGKFSDTFISLKRIGISFIITSQSLLTTYPSKIDGAALRSVSKLALTSQIVTKLPFCSDIHFFFLTSPASLCENAQLLPINS